MKQIVILRFGDRPNPVVTEALVPHMTGKSIALPVPGAIMSIISTESTVEQVSASLKETGAFFFCFERGAAGSNLPQELDAAIKHVLKEESKPVPREWTIDEVLDIISERGMDALTPEQRAVLDRGQQ